MNEVIKNIVSRRSVRAFKREPVPDEAVQQIIACGLDAPSSKNAQPWRLHVVQDEATLGTIAEIVDTPDALQSKPVDPKSGLPNEAYQATVKESADIVRSAPVAIFVENTSPFMGGKRAVIKSPHAEKAIDGLQFELIGIGAAIENMLLAAHSLQLGAVFMGDLVIEEQKIKNVLAMTGDFIGVVAIGYPQQAELWNKPLEAGRVIYH